MLKKKTKCWTITKVDSDNFQNCNITRDKMWGYYYEPESKRQSMGWRHGNFPWKKMKKQPPSESDVHRIGLDNLEPRQPPQSPIWLPSDFQLFELIKRGLWGQHFPDNDAVIAVVKKVGRLHWKEFWRTQHASSKMKMHKQWWSVCGNMFCRWKLALSNIVIVSSASVAVFVEINRRYYCPP